MKLHQNMKVEMVDIISIVKTRIRKGDATTNGIHLICIRLNLYF